MMSPASEVPGLPALPGRLAGTFDEGPVVVLGAQWGDEGKGKIVDLLAAQAGLVVRFGGGANAGHTIVTSAGKKYATHLLPSGIVRPGTRNLVGAGVVCGLAVLRDELAIARENGAFVLLDRSASVVHAAHRWLDKAREARSPIGTTGRGIGPAYADIAARRAVRLGDLTNESRVRAVLDDCYAEMRATAAAYDDLRLLGKLPPFPTLDETVAEIMAYRDDVVPLLCDGVEVAWEAAAEEGTKVLFEGAQGVMLDLWLGQSPHTTSSACTIAGVRQTFGNLPLGKVVGVAKAYATRVGDGPFPTELTNATGEYLRELGQEYGATTGRPRRCGWLDLPALRYAVRMGGITHLVVTKLDTLGELDMPISVCDGYLFEGRAVRRNERLTSRIMREAVPVYSRGFEGWNDLAQARSLRELPKAARAYLEMVAQAAGVEVLAAGVGAGRDELAA